MKGIKMDMEHIAQNDWYQEGLRYYRYSFFLNQKFGKRIYKVCLDAGFGCPNFDGVLSNRGCLFCDRKSFTPTQKLRLLPIDSQIKEQSARLSSRYGRDVYHLAYFQAGTNTYTTAKKLRELFDLALLHPRVLGMVIGTRPDCVTDEILDLFQEYAEKIPMSIEYGLQTTNDITLKRINRGHDAESFYRAVERTFERGVGVGAHVILGLPGESYQDMLGTARELSAIKIDAIKIHNLYIPMDAMLAELYQKGEIKVIERDEYLNLLIDFIELLRPDIVIQRLLADAPRRFLLAPSWIHDKQAFLRLFDKTLLERDSYQGKKYPGANL